ncbi:MAG: glycosyltransferase family 4 protein [Candidatus Woesearchaeota archaeon]
MRILGAIAHVGMGGGQVTQSVRILREMAKDNDVTLVTLWHKSDIVNPGIKTIYAGEFSWPKGIFAMAKTIRDIGKNYDVIQCFDGYYSFPAAFLARKKPYFLRMGMDPKSFLEEKKAILPGFFSQLQMMPLAIRDCSRFIVNSNDLKNVCRQWDPMVIHNGYDQEGFRIKTSKKRLRQELGLPQDKFLVIYTGKIIRRKNLELLFRLGGKSTGLHLALLGEASDSAYMAELTAGYPHANYSFLPEVNMDEVKRYLGAADCLLFPSTKEGQPNSVLEAMAAGLPVVCSDIPSHREIIKHGKNGLLFKDEKGILECIKLLGKQNRIGLEAREYVRKNHNIRDSARQYISLYEEHLR